MNQTEQIILVVGALLGYITIGGLSGLMADNQENKYRQYKSQRKAETNTGGKKYTRKIK